MKVKELIEKLSGFDKEILVDKHCYALTAEAVKQWFEKQIK